MNLVSYGSENIILNGNPKKTFFKATYNKYTNFGMQRFRLDYNGQRRLHYGEETEMIFKIQRYADLLADTYVVVNLPNIWSPLFWNKDASGIAPYGPGSDWASFDFKWIDNLGAQMIKEIKIFSGGTTLAEYPGEWLYAMTQRDFNKTKKNLWNKMVGSIDKLKNPAKAMEKNVTAFNEPHYPSVINDLSCNQIEPSIRAHQLYIPIDAWFCGEGKMALPLVSVQYQEIYIKITFRPICELFTIRNVTDASNNFPYISPKLTSTQNPSFNNIWHFLSPPTVTNISTDASQNFYPDHRQDWDADIHLIANYIFLAADERAQFAQNEQTYLIKETHTYDFLNVTGSSIIEMDSLNMVASYMWRFRRSDSNLRNEWSNYSNWAYDGELPVPPDPSGVGLNTILVGNTTLTDSIFHYNCLHTENIQNILIDLAIVLDGNYREDMMQAGIWNLIEKYTRTTGNAKNGLYCYNFCLNSNQREYQPSGAMNLNKYKKVQFEFNTIQPPINPNSEFQVICDPSGAIIGVRKEIWKQNNYNFDLRIFEERYNVIVIVGGNIGLMLAR